MYTFNLQAVLDHRQLIEDQLKRELAHLQHSLQLARQELERLENRMNATMVTLQQEQAAGMSSGQVVAVHAYLRRLSERISRQTGLVVDVEKQASTKRDQLNEALKRRKILENLKEQGLERYQRMMVKKEMNFIDEIAVSRFVKGAMAKNGEGQ